MEETIPGYKFIKKLGTGGMATVYLAKDTKTLRQVALKVLAMRYSKSPNVIARFTREANLLVKFNHLNIVKGYKAGDFKGLRFVVMEYIDGTSVLELIKKSGPLSEPRAIDIILQMAEAIDYIQSNGYVHRDVKPSNIMLTKINVAKLCDLGIAEPIRTSLGEDATSTSGTPQYISPEQAQGKMDIDVRSDIYSLGATLYHMVMGKVPFEGESQLDIIAKQVLDDINSSEVKNKRISPHMHYFIERMMAKDRDLRYENPKALVEDMKAQIEGYKELQFERD